MMTSFWSLTTADSGVVPPLDTDVVPGDTETLVTTGAITVMAAVPVCPSLVAVIVTGPPTATAVTIPPDDTVATPLFEVDQLTTRPVSVVPAASRNVAESCTVAPGVRFCVDGDTATVATGGGTTVTVAEPSCPSLEATIVTGPPTATAVTIPVDDTVAMAVFVEDQVTVRPARAPPWASRGVAVSWVVCPVASVDVGGVTATDATGGGGSVPPLHARITVRQAVKMMRTARVTRIVPGRFFRDQRVVSVRVGSPPFMERT